MENILPYKKELECTLTGLVEYNLWLSWQGSVEEFAEAHPRETLYCIGQVQELAALLSPEIVDRCAEREPMWAISYAPHLLSDALFGKCFEHNPLSAMAFCPSRLSVEQAKMCKETDDVTFRMFAKYLHPDVRAALYSKTT